MTAGLLAVLAMACLPHDALGRVEEAPAAVWHVSTESRELLLTRQFVRSFRDGSVGWLYCLDGTSTCAELRAFPEGDILSLEGLDRFSEPDRADLVGAWPILSPKVVEEPGLLISWPLGHDGRNPERIAARGGWQREGGSLAWRAVLGRAGVYDRGEILASVELDGQGTRAGEWTLRYERCTAPATCAVLARTGKVTRLTETRPRARVAPCAEGPDPARAPLCLADGTRIADDPAARRGLDF